MEQANIKSFRKKLLKAETIGLDSMIFLYHFADHRPYASLTEVVFESLEQNKLKAVTSTVTIAETFVRAEDKKDQLTIASYEQFFQTMPNLEIIPIDWYIARLSAKLRAMYPSIRLPDAMQLSAPLLKNYPLFLTNDEKMKKVKEIDVVVLEEYAKSA